MLKRLIYIPYYIIRTPSAILKKNIAFVKKNRHVSATRIFCDMLVSSVKYNISFVDYFNLRFFELNKAARNEFVGSGAMYEFQLKMNPKKYRKVLSDKIEFLKKFDDLAGREWATIDMIKQDTGKTGHILSNPTGRIVLKNATGQAGKEVDILPAKDFDQQSLIKKMESTGYDLLESYVLQHDRLMELSPSGLNTVRLITQYYQENIIILAARLRISVNSKTDNLSTGNMAAHVDMQTGKVAAPAIYRDITKEAVTEHPVTGVKIVGFQLPFWNECLDLVKKAALRTPENRSIGWDVAITNNGPVLIEGNHNWNYFIWQMPEQKGYKSVLTHYASSI
ncbi:MAG: hypothetical protein KF862_12905 [Chitinophagaceae bacterium]|nr:hypothetical protein [Chitinophagaceae bacterium]